MIKALRLAKEGMELHETNAPEYIVCAELLRLHELNAELVKALRKIASTDYRGNQPQEIAIARAALAKVETSK